VTTVIAFAFVLGVLVFVHELGHFLAAKRVGIRVLKFQLGFNPTIVSVRRGDTEYGIGALPLGGYVKMAGENPEDVHTGQADEFMSKTRWQRFQVLIMGPAMNILLAFVLTAFVFYRGAEVPAYVHEAPLVGTVLPGTPAENAGIQPNDLITSFDDEPVATWEQLFDAVTKQRPGAEVRMGVERNGQPTSLVVTPAVPQGSRYEVPDIGVVPNIRPRITMITAKPAADAGLEAGDVVLAINGQPMTSLTKLSDDISAHPGERITLVVRRDGRELTLQATPGTKRGAAECVPPGENSAPAAGKGGCLGIALGEETTNKSYGAVESIQRSFQKNVEYSGLIFKTVWGLLTRETSPKQLMGPVAIAQLSGESAKLGLVALFNLMAMISLNLGILNLLPIPVLDGGHIMIMALEGIARRDFSVRMKEKMLLAGLAVLLLLMVTVFYNDLSRIGLFDRLMPWR
jgi:regulator of sigma E protease